MNETETRQAQRSVSLPTLLHERIEEMILEGQLMPGEALREVPLAALLGVSRGPLREAFRTLQEKGLVHVVRNCGVYVRTLDLAEADQIYAVRIALESLIGQEAARRADAAARSLIEQSLERMRDAHARGDINAYSALNVQFHDLLARATGNRTLASTYQRLVRELTLFRRQKYVLEEDSLASSLAEHTRIAQAVLRGDPDEAASLLVLHAADSRRRLHRLLPDPTSGRPAETGRA